MMPQALWAAPYICEVAAVSACTDCPFLLCAQFRTHQSRSTPEKYQRRSPTIQQLFSRTCQHEFVVLRHHCGCADSVSAGQSLIADSAGTAKQARGQRGACRNGGKSISLTRAPGMFRGSLSEPFRTFGPVSAPLSLNFFSAES